MTDHADTIRRARDTSQKLAGEFTEGDPSDVWTQGEVYEHVYDPLDKDARALCDLAESLLAENRKFRILLAEGTAERQQAIDERDARATYDELLDAERRALAAEEDLIAEKARCEQAIDALRRLKGQVWAWEVPDDVREQVDAVLREQR